MRKVTDKEVKEFLTKNAEYVPEGNQIDFVKVSKEALAKPQLRSYPIDDAVIKAFGITDKELEGYADLKYAKYHWSAILSDILHKRGLLKYSGMF
jgi:hypothetical protein